MKQAKILKTTTKLGTSSIKKVAKLSTPIKGKLFSLIYTQVEKPVELLFHLLILIVKTLEQSVLSLKQQPEQQPEVSDLLQGFSGYAVVLEEELGRSVEKAGQREGCVLEL